MQLKIVPGYPNYIPSSTIYFSETSIFAQQGYGIVKFGTDMGE